MASSDREAARRTTLADVPEYYRIRVRPLEGGRPVTIDHAELARALALTYFEGIILKHVIRRGTKPGESRLSDARKTAVYARRWLEAEQIAEAEHYER